MLLLYLSTVCVFLLLLCICLFVMNAIYLSFTYLRLFVCDRAVYLSVTSLHLSVLWNSSFLKVQKESTITTDRMHYIIFCLYSHPNVCHRVTFLPFYFNICWASKHIKHFQKLTSYFYLFRCYTKVLHYLMYHIYKARKKVLLFNIQKDIKVRNETLYKSVF